MRFYPLFFPKHTGVMVSEADCEDVKCAMCDQPFMECCRTSSSLWSFRRFCKCSNTLCEIGTKTIEWDGNYSHDLRWIPCANRFRFIPFNWRAAILGATYTLPDKDRDYLTNKRSNLLDKLNKIATKNPEPVGKELEHAKRLYNELKDLDSILRMY